MVTEEAPCLEKKSRGRSVCPSGGGGSILDLLKIVKTIITPYHPSANGQVQRMNRTILQIIRCFIQGQQEVWDQHLGTVGQLFIVKLVRVDCW